MRRMSRHRYAVPSDVEMADADSTSTTNERKRRQDEELSAGGTRKRSRKATEACASVNEADATALRSKFHEVIDSSFHEHLRPEYKRAVEEALAGKDRPSRGRQVESMPNEMADVTYAVANTITDVASFARLSSCVEWLTKKYPGDYTGTVSTSDKCGMYVGFQNGLSLGGKVRVPDVRYRTVPLCLAVHVSVVPIENAGDDSDPILLDLALFDEDDKMVSCDVLRVAAGRPSRGVLRVARSLFAPGRAYTLRHAGSFSGRNFVSHVLVRTVLVSRPVACAPPLIAWRCATAFFSGGVASAVLTDLLRLSKAAPAQASAVALWEEFSREAYEVARSVDVSDLAGAVLEALPCVYKDPLKCVDALDLLMDKFEGEDAASVLRLQGVVVDAMPLQALEDAIFPRGGTRGMFTHSLVIEHPRLATMVFRRFPRDSKVWDMSAIDADSLAVDACASGNLDLLRLVLDARGPRVLCAGDRALEDAPYRCAADSGNMTEEMRECILQTIVAASPKLSKERARELCRYLAWDLSDGANCAWLSDQGVALLRRVFANDTHRAVMVREMLAICAHIGLGPGSEVWGDRAPLTDPDPDDADDIFRPSCSASGLAVLAAALDHRVYDDDPGVIAPLQGVAPRKLQETLLRAVERIISMLPLDEDMDEDIVAETRAVFANGLLTVFHCLQVFAPESAVRGKWVPEPLAVLLCVMVDDEYIRDFMAIFAGLEDGIGYSDCTRAIAAAAPMVIERLCAMSDEFVRAFVTHNVRYFREQMEDATPEMEAEHVLVIDRSRIVASALAAPTFKNKTEMGSLNPLMISARFEGELGKGPGVVSAALTAIARELLSRREGLFVTRHAGTGAYFSESATDAESLVKYRLFGRLMGCAVVRREPIDAHLAPAFMMLFMDNDYGTSFDALAKVDPELHASLSKHVRDVQLDAAALSVLGEPRFTRALSSGEEIELCEGGREMALSEGNKGRYLDLMAQSIVRDSVIAQMDALSDGFADVLTYPVDTGFLRLLPPDALGKAIFGLQRVSGADLRRLAVHYAPHAALGENPGDHANGGRRNQRNAARRGAPARVGAAGANAAAGPAEQGQANAVGAAQPGPRRSQRLIGREERERGNRQETRDRQNLIAALNFAAFVNSEHARAVTDAVLRMTDLHGMLMGGDSEDDDDDSDFDADAEFDMFWGGDLNANGAPADVVRVDIDKMHPAAAMFWRWVDGLSPEEIGDLLEFVTGSRHLPPDALAAQERAPGAHDDDEANYKIEITVDPNLAKDAYPTARTCSRQLVLPPYEDEATLRDKLKTAISQCRDFGFV